MALEILELAAGVGELWFWFALTGSCLVWVVTFGTVWMLEDHPHLAGLIGVLLHVAIVVAVVVFWNSGSGEKAPPGPARTESRSGHKATQE